MFLHSQVVLISQFTMNSQRNKNCGVFTFSLPTFTVHDFVSRTHANQNFFLVLIYSLSFFCPSRVHDYTLALSQVAVFFPLSVPSLLCMILHLALNSHFTYCPYLLSQFRVRIYLLSCPFSPPWYHMQLFCISQPGYTTCNYFVGNDKTNIKYTKNNQLTHVNLSR